MLLLLKQAREKKLPLEPMFLGERGIMSIVGPELVILILLLVLKDFTVGGIKELPLP